MRTALALSALAVATVAWGLIASGAGAGLGTANPPFFLIYDTGFDGVAGVLWLALLLGCAGAVVPLVRSGGSPLSFLAGIVLLGLGARLALAGVRDGTAGWYSTGPIVSDHLRPWKGLTSCPDEPRKPGRTHPRDVAD